MRYTTTGLELPSTSYQSVLQEESHIIDLLYIQIDKYEIEPKIEYIKQLCVKTAYIKFILPILVE